MRQYLCPENRPIVWNRIARARVAWIGILVILVCSYCPADYELWDNFNSLSASESLWDTYEPAFEDHLTFQDGSVYLHPASDGESHVEFFAHDHSTGQRIRATAVKAEVWFHELTAAGNAGVALRDCFLKPGASHSFVRMGIYNARSVSRKSPNCVVYYYDSNWNLIDAAVDYDILTGYDVWTPQSYEAKIFTEERYVSFRINGQQVWRYDLPADAWFVDPDADEDNFNASILTRVNSQSTGYVAAGFDNFHVDYTMIELLEPNGGEVFDVDDTMTIRWRFKTNLSAQVDLHLFKGGSYFRTIRNGTANDGYYSWAIPDDLPAGNNYSVSVIESADQSVHDESDAYFTINQGAVALSSISVVGPSEVEESSFADYSATAYFTDGSQNTVTSVATWSENSEHASMDASVKGRLLTNDVSQDRTLTVSASYQYEGITKTGTQVVTIKNFVIRELGNGELVAPLSATRNYEAHYKITVPDGQTKLEIKIWGDSGDCDLYVRYGEQCSTTDWDYRPFAIGSNETVTIDYPQSGVWYIMLRAYQDYSDISLMAEYERVLPAMQLIDPNGGEVYEYGDTMNIRWDFPQELSESVKIRLFNNGELVSTLVKSTENDGSFEVVVSDALPISNQYSILVVTTEYSSVRDESDATFTIQTRDAKPLFVLSPNGSENWIKGRDHLILWDTLPWLNYNNVVIDLYRSPSEDPQTWIFIKRLATTENDGYHVYRVGESLPTDWQYRIGICAVEDAAAWDFSDGFFRVLEEQTDIDGHDWSLYE